MFDKIKRLFTKKPEKKSIVPQATIKPLRGETKSQNYYDSSSDNGIATYAILGMIDGGGSCHKSADDAGASHSASNDSAGSHHCGASHSHSCSTHSCSSASSCGGASCGGGGAD